MGLVEGWTVAVRADGVGEGYGLHLRGTWLPVEVLASVRYCGGGEYNAARVIERVRWHSGQMSSMVRTAEMSRRLHAWMIRLLVNASIDIVRREQMSCR